MEFTVRKIKNRLWPVTVTGAVCQEDGSVTVVKQTFIAHWAPFTAEDLEGINQELDKRFPKTVITVDAEGKMKLPDGKFPSDSQVLARNAAFYPQLIKGWGAEVKDEAGNAIPYSESALAAMITGPDGMAFSNGLGAALQEIRTGAAPLKNSPTSPESGPPPASVEAETKSLAT